MSRPRPNRIVVKLGTRVLTNADGHLATDRMRGIVDAIARVRAEGTEVLVVSSGAVGVGRDVLGIGDGAEDLATRQACAAVGQSRLMAWYDEHFSRHGLACGQVLLSQTDFDHRVRYLNLRSTLLAMLHHSVVPVINENDAVATDELAFDETVAAPVFGDNDRLSALVAAKLDADLLVLLTDVDGVYEHNPQSEPGAHPISVWSSDHADGVNAIGADSTVSRGGMKSKIASATLAARAGCTTVIANGQTPGVLARVVAGEAIGTEFPATEGLPARKRWIATAAKIRGQLHLDAGAVRALRERGASLLAAGVHRVEGDFEVGDVVTLLDPESQEVGRGIVHCDASTARAWSQGQRPKGARNHDALVHRDHLVVHP